jgi:Restriction endonuclease
MNWKSYEQITKAIYESLGAQAGVIIEGFGHTCKRKGKSGDEHQIDVLTSHTDGAHKYHTVIECKHWNKKIQKGVINKVAYIRDDCNYEKAIVVSNKGFTESASKVAKDQNVHLVELTEHNVFIAHETLTKVYMHAEISETKLNSIEFSLNRIEKKYSNIIPPLNQNWGEYKLIKPNGRTYLVIDEAAQFLNHILDNGDTFDMQTEDISFDPGTKIKFTGSKRAYLIDGLKLTGFKFAHTCLDPDYFKSKIWLLMKFLFEQKNMVVTIDGRIEPEPLRDPVTLFKGQRAKITFHGSARQFKIRLNPALIA